METGIRVSDVEIVRLTSDFSLMPAWFETAARLGARQVLVAGNDNHLTGALKICCARRSQLGYGLTMNLEPMPDPKHALSLTPGG